MSSRVDLPAQGRSHGFSRSTFYDIRSQTLDIEHLQTSHAGCCRQPLQHTQHCMQKHCQCSGSAMLAEPAGSHPRLKAQPAPSALLAPPCQRSRAGSACSAWCACPAPAALRQWGHPMRVRPSQHTRAQVAMTIIVSGKEIATRLHGRIHTLQARPLHAKSTGNWTPSSSSAAGSAPSLAFHLWRCLQPPCTCEREGINVRMEPCHSVCLKLF